MDIMLQLSLPVMGILSLSWLRNPLILITLHTNPSLLHYANLG